jgi:hypothetical protein
MDYELAFWIGALICTLIFVLVVRAVYGPSKTVSDETLRRLFE